jgi:hypothetical protein
MEIVKEGSKQSKLGKLVTCSSCASIVKLDYDDVRLETIAYCICDGCKSEIPLSLSYKEVQLIKKAQQQQE